MKKDGGIYMSKQLSFIHAADLHLDSPFKGLANTPDPIFKEVRESTFVALDNLVQAAINQRVDFVLIVGDLFDNEKQSLKAQIRLKKAFEKLQNHEIYVYMSYGNHDYINGNKHPVAYPDNVYIFSKEEVQPFPYQRNGEVLALIYGFSYENRAVVANKVNEFQITDTSVPFHIAMLHGSVQSNTEHDRYAPFQVQELSERHFDYWALGHIHKRQILKETPAIVYPGNIQGRNRKETGMKGCYHVVLNEGTTDLAFIPLQAIQINPLVVNVSPCNSVHEVESVLMEHVNNLTYSTPQLIDLTLISTDQRITKWQQDGRMEEMMELINEATIQSSVWSYIFRYSVSKKVASFDRELYKGDHFISELLYEIDNQSIQPFIAEIYQQKRARKFVERLTIEEEMALKTAVKELLIYELLKE